MRNTTGSKDDFSLASLIEKMTKAWSIMLWKIFTVYFYHKELETSLSWCFLCFEASTFMYISGINSHFISFYLLTRKCQINALKSAFTSQGHSWTIQSR